MRKMLGDMGTMCLGVAAILIAAVIISIGTDAGPQLVVAIGAVVLTMLGVVLHVLSNGNSS